MNSTNQATNQATKIIIPRTLVSIDDDTQRIKMNIDELSSLKKAIITGIGGSGKTTYIQEVFRILGENPLYVDYEVFSRFIMPRYLDDFHRATTGEELRMVSVKALFLYEILANDWDNLIHREDLFEILDVWNEMLGNVQRGIGSSRVVDSVNLREGVSIVIDNFIFNDETKDINFVTWYRTLGLKDSDRVFILTNPKTGSQLSHLLPVYALEDLNPEEVDTIIRSMGPWGDNVLAFIQSITPALTNDPRNLLNTPEEIEAFVKVFEEEINGSNVDPFNAEYLADKMYRGIVWARYRKMVKAYRAIGAEVRDLEDYDANFEYICDLAHLRTGDSDELHNLYIKYRSGKSLAEIRQFSKYRSMRMLFQGF